MRKLRFLDELSRHGNVRVAAGRVGVSRSAVYLAQRRDAEFARGWRAALVLARDHAEAVLAERALEGVEEQIFYRGELVGTRRRYDARLLLAHLGRLDRLCVEEPQAVDDAARFDAVIGEVGDLPQAAECHPETGAPMAWPPRADFIAEARADAVEEARSLIPHGVGPDRWTEEAFDGEAVAAAVTAAGEEWDGFHDELYRAVDAVRGGAVRGGDEPGECGGAGLVVQDSVHSVQSIPAYGDPRTPSRHPRAGGDPSAVCAIGIAGMDSRLRGNDDAGEGEGEGHVEAEGQG
ncbi:hypothetical protein [Novosphingobium sp.]|uniref:hypothetical protein n=1 Tax=Novosphingobium sp. TaxID=1874826 RepID=UPI00286E5862|nr:hypothetical protein [Novosphingobium sp.]